MLYSALDSLLFGLHYDNGAGDVKENEICETVHFPRKWEQKNNFHQAWLQVETVGRVSSSSTLFHDHEEANNVPHDALDFNSFDQSIVRSRVIRL